MPRPSRPAKPRRRRAKSGFRQVAWVAVIGVSLGLGAYWAADFYRAQRDAQVAETDDDIYTGSILFMADKGDLCHQLLFDNQSGQVSDNGYVDCLKAAYR